MQIVEEPMSSGYTECRCRDCFEIAISDDENNPDLCLDCEEAGCEGDSECACDLQAWHELEENL